MDIKSLFNILETPVEDTNDLSLLSNHKTNYFGTASDILPDNLTLEYDTNSVKDLLSAEDLLINRLESISTDSESDRNPESDPITEYSSDTNNITGNSSDSNNIQRRAGNKSDNNIKSATEIDIISGEKIKINDRIGYQEKGKPDKYDYYSFSLSEDSEVSIQLNKLKQNANLHLFDEDGKTVLEKSNRKGNKSENINEYLKAGDYYLRVSAAGTAKTPYRLTVETIPDDGNIDGANDLGILSNTTKKEQDKIGHRKNGKRDTKDFYSFEINEEREVDITLNRLQQNANIKLIDEDGETVLDKSTNGGKNSDKITEVLEPGTYYVEVSASGKDKTNYQLILKSETVNKVLAEEGVIYESGTRIGFENRVSFEVPKGYVGQYDNDTLFLTYKKYPDVHIEVNGGGSFWLGSMQELVNAANQETEFNGVSLEPQGKAKLKGNQVTNTYVNKNLEPQEKLYAVGTIGPNNEVIVVEVGGSANQLKDYKDIANDVVESLDFPEPTDWESYLSDRWLSYYYNSDFLEFDSNFNGFIDPWEEYDDLEISEGIFLYGDRSFNYHYDSYDEIIGNANWILSGTWYITENDELALRYEDGSVTVEPLSGPDVDHEVFYGDTVYQVNDIT